MNSHSTRAAIDPRVGELAKRRYNAAHVGRGDEPLWDQLPGQQRDDLEQEAADWLRAAVEAGIAPPAARPSREHDAVWLDNNGRLWGEYQTCPPSNGDAILPLVWASEECSSMRERRDDGASFRLIGWSQ